MKEAKVQIESLSSPEAPDLSNGLNLKHECRRQNNQSGLDFDLAAFVFSYSKPGFLMWVVVELESWLTNLQQPPLKKTHPAHSESS